MSIFTPGDFGRKKETVHKTRLATQDKSKKVFCRNCNAQNIEAAKICKQCDCTIREPKLRRKMR